MLRKAATAATLLASATAGFYLYQKNQYNLSATPLVVPQQQQIVPSVVAEKLVFADQKERERTFIAVKPDGVQRGLVGEIIKRFEQRGYKLVAIKMLTPPKALVEEHYADLSSRPFFNGLVNYMAQGPVVAMVWEGTDVVKTGRKLIGETNPLASAPGTIRGDFCIQLGRNIIHGSDSVDSAKQEISLWFKPTEVIGWNRDSDKWIYE